MKRLIFILATMVTLAACNSDDDAGTVATYDFENIKTVLPNGSWEISKLVDGQDDHTSNFESFTFYFDSDGTVEAKTDLFTEPGTWAYVTTSADGEELVLQFGQPDPFDEISDDWDIISVTNAKIELKDDDGNEGVELLTFSKL